MKKSTIAILVSIVTVSLLFWQNMILRQQNLKKNEKLSVISENIAPVVNNVSFKDLPTNVKQHMSVIANATGVRIDYGSEK